ncbi:MAG: hypothetical protein Ct9H300mP16_19090 [Pseudomonadota bacterium]|nr:MAG: hypothetical protein Ct9H300mP16_19090 [Pseudomonadota bacterium]
MDRAPPVEGTFLVNIGDMMMRWTNNLFRSTPHRVVTRTQKKRYSFPFFFAADYNTVVGCLDTCVSEDNPPGYPPTKFGYWVENMHAYSYVYRHVTAASCRTRNSASEDSNFSGIRIQPTGSLAVARPKYGEETVVHPVTVLVSITTVDRSRTYGDVLGHETGLGGDAVDDQCPPFQRRLIGGRSVPGPAVVE